MENSEFRVPNSPTSIILSRQAGTANQTQFCVPTIFDSKHNSGSVCFNPRARTRRDFSLELEKRILEQLVLVCAALILCPTCID